MLDHTQIKMTESKFRQSNLIRIVFIVIMITLIISFFIQAYINRGVASQVFFTDPGATFMDFFGVEKQLSTSSPVQDGQIYPPLAYIVMYPFHSFVDYSQVDPYAARSTQGGVMSYAIFLIIWMFIAGVFLNKLFSKEDWQKSIIVFLLFLSAPMLFLVERGNTNIAVLAFLAIFFSCYEDKNKLVREVGIIALAFATGIKLYPALLGLLLLNKNTFRMFLRLVIYCIALITLPFLLFKGGLLNVATMFNNIFYYSNSVINSDNTLALYGRIGFHAFFRALSIKLGFISMPEWLITVYKVVNYLSVTLSILGSFLVKKKWQKAALLTCPIMLFPSVSAFYNTVFMLIPIILFLKEEEKRWIDYVYLLLFLIVLNPVQYGVWISMVTNSIIATNISMIIMNGLLISESLIALTKTITQRICGKKDGTFEMREIAQADCVTEISYTHRRV